VGRTDEQDGQQNDRCCFHSNSFFNAEALRREVFSPISVSESPQVNDSLMIRQEFAGNVMVELSRFCKFCDTAQHGEAATKGARVYDPQELCPSSVLTYPVRRSISTCCGSQSRAPDRESATRSSFASRTRADDST
jgi:hypothetical protein